MTNNLKFEFDFDEVFEGIKQGVIREMAETNFEEARDSVVNQLKTEIKNEIKLTYKDEYEMRDEIKKEIKDKVYTTLIGEVNEKYLNQFDDYIETQLTKNPDRLEKLQSEIKTKLIDDLYYDLRANVQREMNEQNKALVSQIMNTVGDNNLKITETNQMITKEEYDNLVHKSEVLEALEQGGVDNWEWYGESIQKYFGEDEE